VKTLLAAGVLLAGVDEPSRSVQSALRPAGPQAGHIADLWWLFFFVTVAVYVITVGLALLATRRSLPALGSGASVPVLPCNEQTESRLSKVVAGAVAATVVILFVLLISDFRTGQAQASLQDPDPLIIKVTAHQWWWDFEYQDSTASNTFHTANEIHLPIGKAVRFDLRSNDVIHSFWIPNVIGKKDAIPGHPTSTWAQVDQPGTYRGQCAEFCGAQHAKMRFIVVAEAPESFDAWIAAQRQPAPEPVTDVQRRGHDVFMSSTCVMCHAIQGTDAHAAFGPNLTHLAGRQMLAGATLPNNRGNLAGWIIDPQHIKPGVEMPQNTLEPEQLQSLLDYLETLK
jgi:cytochrome c oxidase subunit 2